MKDAKDLATQDAFAEPKRGRGRPCTSSDAKRRVDAAVRQARHREKLRRERARVALLARARREADAVTWRVARARWWDLALYLAGLSGDDQVEVCAFHVDGYRTCSLMAYSELVSRVLDGARLSMGDDERFELKLGA